MGYLLLFIKILMLLNYYQGSLADSEENFTANIEEDLQAFYIPNHETHSMQMNISWSDHLSEEVHAIMVSSLESQFNNCSQTTCDTIRYPKEINSILLPEHPKVLTEHDPECSFLGGCEYTINLLSFDNSVITNRTIYIPECSLGQCYCRSNIMLNLQTNVIDLDTVNLSWTIQFENNIKLNDTVQKELYVRITKTNSTLPWGELIPSKIKILAENIILLNITSSLSSQYIFKDNIEVKTKSSLVPGSSYFIYVDLLDIRNNCLETDKKFNFLVPQQNAVVSKIELNMYIVIIIVAISILMISPCVILYSKLIKRNKNVAIPLHENILYSRTDQRRLLDDYELPGNNIKLGKLKKAGEFGEVYEGELINLSGFANRMKVAIKLLKGSNGMFFYERKEDFLEEISTMKKIGRHENIVEFIGCCTMKDPFMLVMEYVGGGDLKDHLTKVRQRVSLLTCSSNFYNSSENKNPKGRYLELSSVSIDSDKLSRAERPSLTETTYTILSDNSAGSNYTNNNSLDYSIDIKELQNFAYQIANGMAYLEKLGITHRDLAARNILIGEGKILKITDFGLSRDGIYIRKIGTIIPFRWCSIEALLDNFYSSKSDVWAFGVVLWEIGTLGSHPYSGIQNIPEIIEFFRAGRRLEKPGICSDELYNLMLNCWLENYNKRPSFEEILAILRAQQKSSYIDLRYLSSDYVFPPTQKELDSVFK